MDQLSINSTNSNSTVLFPNWSWQTTQQVTLIYICVQAVILTILFGGVLVNMFRGRKSMLVLRLSLMFICSNVLLSVATFVYKSFQQCILQGEWAKADNWGVAYTTLMALSIIFLAVPHWLFFSMYFECSCTVPYFYNQK